MARARGHFKVDHLARSDEEDYVSYLHLGWHGTHIVTMATMEHGLATPATAKSSI